MRSILRCSLIVYALASQAAFAQTCQAPASFQPPPSGGQVSGDTCAGDTTAPGYCGTLAAPGPAYVFDIAITGNRTFNSIVVSGEQGFAPVAYLSLEANGCGTNAPCVPPGQIPDGSYFLIVTAPPTAGNGTCGLFTLSADGSLPVTLETFTVT